MEKAIENALDAFQFKFGETAAEAGFKYVRRCKKSTIMFAQSQKEYDAYIKRSQTIKKVFCILVFWLLAIIGESVFFFNFSFEHYHYLSTNIANYWFLFTSILFIVIVYVNYKMERKCNKYESQYEKNHFFYDENENKFYKLERTNSLYQEVVWY